MNLEKLLLLLFAFNFVLCDYQEKKSSFKTKPSYIAHVNAMSPYELYLDDILVDYNYGYYINNTTELNPYLLSNGKHTLKIKFLPREDASDKLVSPKDIIFNESAKWKLFFMKINLDKDAPLGYSNEIDYAKSELKIAAPTEKVPYWEQSWDVEVKDLPYQLKGWSESENLEKIDKEVLLKEVKEYYTTLKDLLNEGKIDEFLKLCKKEDEELDIATYTTPEDSKADYQSNKENMSKLCVGNMQSLDNVEMKIYGNGRLVKLVIPNGEYKNWNALMSKTSKGRVTSWGVLLHKPKGSSNFEIIR